MLIINRRGRNYYLFGSALHVSHSVLKVKKAPGDSTTYSALGSHTWKMDMGFFLDNKFLIHSLDCAIELVMSGIILGEAEINKGVIVGNNIHFARFENILETRHTI